VDAENGTPANRLIKGDFAACTNGEAWRIIGHGFIQKAAA
jgi:hypothetical protein